MLQPDYAMLASLFGPWARENLAGRTIAMPAADMTIAVMLEADRIGCAAEPLERDYRAVLSADPCSYCGAPGPNYVDHIRAKRKGGPNSIWNYTAVCAACNSGKSNRPLFEFLSRLPAYLARRAASPVATPQPPAQPTPRLPVEAPPEWATFELYLQWLNEQSATSGSANAPTVATSP